MERQQLNGTPTSLRGHCIETVSESRAPCLLLPPKFFTGIWVEDFHSTKSVYETMATICEVADEEKLKANLVMLFGDFLIYHPSHVKQSVKYEDFIGVPRMWYKNVDKRLRIIIKWQSMRFTRELMNGRNKAEVDVSRKLFAELMSLQKQLNLSYHSDRFPRDQLMTAVDISAVQIALRESIRRRTQQLTNGITNGLIKRPGTTGSAHLSYSQGGKLSQEEEAI